MNANTKNSMWGGRFSDKPSDIMEQINASIGVDYRLWRQDLALSMAHAEMLGRQKIIAKDEAKALIDGLVDIEAEIKAGSFDFKVEFEDIHMNIEARLRDIVGDVAGKLHTARSRNCLLYTSPSPRD